MRLFVETQELIGDTLMMTPALRAFKQANPQARIVVVTEPDGLTHLALRHHPAVEAFWTKGRALGAKAEGDRWVELTASKAFQYGVRRHRPLVEGYAAQLGVTLESQTLDFHLIDDERQAGRALLETFGAPYKVVVCARHSTSCYSNVNPGAEPNKCFDNAVWREVAEWLIGLGYVPLAVGDAAEADDPRFLDWPGPRLYGHPLRTIAGLVASARAVFCVDTGLRHLAAAVGVDLACLSGAIPPWLISSLPTAQDQRIAERFLPVAQVTTDVCKELLWPLL